MRYEDKLYLFFEQLEQDYNLPANHLAALWKEFKTKPSVKADGKCHFQKAWIGRCNKPTDNVVCEEHDKKCPKCGLPIMKDCDNTIYGMVCGAPVCDDHPCSCSKARY